MLAACSASSLVGATLLGTCALLITRTAERALEVAAGRAAPDDVDVTAYTGTVKAPTRVRSPTDTRDVVTAALAPFAATTTARASTIMRALPPGRDQPAVPSRAGLSVRSGRPAGAGPLTAGRWPRPRRRPGSGRAGSTARQLGLAPGGRIRLERGAWPHPAYGRSSDRRRHRAPAAGRRLGPRHARRRRLRPGYSDGRFERSPVTAYGPFSSTSRPARHRRPPSTAWRSPPIRTCPTRPPGPRAVAAACAVPTAGSAVPLGDRVQLERVASALPVHPARRRRPAPRHRRRRARRRRARRRPDRDRPRPRRPAHRRACAPTKPPCSSALGTSPASSPPSPPLRPVALAAVAAALADPRLLRPARRPDPPAAARRRRARQPARR